jgi:hypothetical protein
MPFHGAAVLSAILTVCKTEVPTSYTEFRRSIPSRNQKSLKRRVENRFGYRSVVNNSANPITAGEWVMLIVEVCLMVFQPNDVDKYVTLRFDNRLFLILITFD